MGPPQQRCGRIRDLFLGAAGDLGASVVPGQLTEGDTDTVQVLPEHGDPLIGAGVAHPG
ncbi:hypothetical protein [Streptomyces sp. NPDC088246]|uniref:hypothetical protein n=1 Tax=Streptomyces sp. NPDC088246 TaxID=3365842 RepID=UPI0037F74488